MTGLSLSARRVYAIVLRNIYLLSSSWTRIANLVYWPLVQIITWGFLQMAVNEAVATSPAMGRVAVGAGALIGAMLLWDILFRGQLGFSLTFLEEMYSRNLGNLLMSPLRPGEFVAAMMVMSIIRVAIGFLPVSILAALAFDFNVWTLGFGFAVFFLNLILTGWAIGLLVAGLIMRNGLGAEELAWTFMFLMMPLACVYYPVTTLPGWLQPAAWALPPTYSFEGMRGVLIDGVFRTDLALTALALNAGLFLIGGLAFALLLRSARRAGSLLSMGE